MESEPESGNWICYRMLSDRTDLSSACLTSTMSLRLPALLFCIAASALALPASAAGRGGHGGGHGGGHHGGGFHRGGGFHHHHFRSGFAFIGVSPFFFGGPPYPYYYPAYAQPAPPTTYIERFGGVPAPGMTDIVCPSTGQRYPAVTECPGGWAREMQAPQQPAG